MNILICLSNNLLGRGLRKLLAPEREGNRVMVMAEDFDAEGFRPHIIIVDSYSLRRGLSFREPEAKVVLIDFGLGEEEITSLLLIYKIDGVLSTGSDLSHLKKALRAIGEGQIWIDNRNVKALIRHAESSSRPDESFSRKEREIVILVSQGLMNREIAERLCIGEQTVKTHISRIFRKVHVSRRSQLVPLALKFTAPLSR
jgi:DNA-binding NarL/FixJ family response regulator